MIQTDRLADTFMSLVQIDSVSRSEGRICRELQKRLAELGADIHIDDSASATGSDTGNLIARFPGSVCVPPLLLNAHMDTVEPGKGVKPTLRQGVFYSDGTTILGADDKSAIAILLEVLSVLRENRIPHGPLEVVLTVCEEIGLLGAKFLDMSQITAAYGYALDATDTNGLITHAPGSNKLKFTVYGKDAHSGASPEKGINAIFIAAKAIAGLKLGRIDRETTCNIGLIQGGLATNIIPPEVVVKGEVRSHDPEKLAHLTRVMTQAFEDAVRQYVPDSPEAGRPMVTSDVVSDFCRTGIPDDHPVVVLAQRAASNLGRSMATKYTGGGADANVFFEKGVMVGVLGTGMRDMHTLRENVRLSDMVAVADLVLEIIRVHAADSGQ